MNTHQRDELYEILGQDDAYLAAILSQNKSRRDAEVDHQARNLSVHVAERLHKATPRTWYALGAVATSVAAVLIMMVTMDSTHDEPVAQVRVEVAPRIVQQQATPPAKSDAYKQIAPKRIQQVADYVPDEQLLEQEAEQQVVEYLAFAVGDDGTWSVKNSDIDMLLQEN